MLKKIDKLILKVYYGPFFLIYGIVLFVFLLQYIIKNFEHFVGKNLGLLIFGELFFYFALVLTPVSLPLSVLLSSLMTFGSLGEHSELTAMKGSGISLLRVLRPATFFILIVTCWALFFNNYIVTWANLQAYSLLYDIKQKKPTLDFKEGIFYNGIPGFSIKVNEKGEDGKSIGDIIIYDHTLRKGNTRIIMAEKGKMEMIRDDHFLALTLENGKSYSDQSAEKRRNTGKSEFLRNDFKKSQILFDLGSFDIKNTDDKLFQSHNMMKRRDQLVTEYDFLKKIYDTNFLKVQEQMYNLFKYFKNPYKVSKKDSTLNINTIGVVSQLSKKSDTTKQKFKSRHQKKFKQQINHENLSIPKQYIKRKFRISEAMILKKAKNDKMKYANSAALSKAEAMNGIIKANKRRIENQRRSIISLEISIYQKLTHGFAVFVMFLIGAPLGAIVKKGGLGVPVLISIFFFVIYYITSITGLKLAKEGAISPFIGTWISNIILATIGLFFLNQAKNDTRILDTDIYVMAFQKFKSILVKYKIVKKEV